MAKSKSAEHPIPMPGRPYMPGYGLPPASEGMLPWKWAQQRLAQSHNYWIATTRPDGSPHVMPVWGIWVDSVFYFSTGRESRKAKNLRSNPRCTICTEKSREAVILEGTAREITDSARIKKLGAPYYKKYKPWKLDPQMGGIYSVQPTRIFALEEKTGLKTATRWLFPA
jgi:general stress protein 26